LAQTGTSAPGRESPRLRRPAHRAATTHPPSPIHHF
jgi:hypothetical protein